MTIDEKRKILQQARNLLAELGNNQPSGDVRTVVSEVIRRLSELEKSLCKIGFSKLSATEVVLRLCDPQTSKDRKIVA